MSSSVEYVEVKGREVFYDCSVRSGTYTHNRMVHIVFTDKSPISFRNTIKNT